MDEGIRILLIDDEYDDFYKTSLEEAFNKNDISIQDIKSSTNFNKGIQIIKNNFFDIIILDWMAQTDVPKGSKVLDIINKDAYTPCIIHTAYEEKMDKRKIENKFAKIIKKGKGSYNTIAEYVKQILETKIFSVKRKMEKDLLLNLRQFWKSYFDKWDLIEQNFKDFQKNNQLLFLNRFSHFISSSRFINNPIFQRETREIGAHELFYVFPPIDEDYFTVGSIITNKNSEETYIILTPTCDMVNRINEKISQFQQIINYSEEMKINKKLSEDAFENRRKKFQTLIEKSKKNGEEERKADFIIISKINKVDKMYENYKNSTHEPKKKKNWFEEIITKERYFLLPDTFFIPESCVDFQELHSIKVSVIFTEYQLFSHLSNNYTMSLISKFSTYFLRFGYEEPFSNVCRRYKVT